VFLGANDNAGGVALLDGNWPTTLPRSTVNYGIDFLLLDGEEFMFPRTAFFPGLGYFARNYVDKPPKYRYRWGVLLDMISDKDLQIYEERNSLGWKDTRPLVEAIWRPRPIGVMKFFTSHIDVQTPMLM